jgi:hypothetical protein
MPFPCFLNPSFGLACGAWAWAEGGSHSSYRPWQLVAPGGGNGQLKLSPSKTWHCVYCAKTSAGSLSPTKAGLAPSSSDFVLMGSIKEVRPACYRATGHRAQSRRFSSSVRISTCIEANSFGSNRRCAHFLGGRLGPLISSWAARAAGEGVARRHRRPCHSAAQLVVVEVERAVSPVSWASEAGTAPLRWLSLSLRAVSAVSL